ncbi:MAG TPA: patatin-like phospholipase family protein [Solirubrobacteraceae bacterium]|nr:patatin-like phospholipase family protein [Solirubrobacteraceae bacterium]
MSSLAEVTPIRTHAARRSAARSGRPYTAFVLSGGASLGALQVGMLRALYERGVAADVLVGTSAGALNAAFVASRPQTPETAAKLARIWRDISRQDIFPMSMRAIMGGLRGQRDHLVPDRGLRRQVRRYIEFDDLSEATVPLHVVAFDIVEGRETLLSAGPAVDAVTASASIPGVFPPVDIGARRLIDGGVANNTPISHAVELGAERIYVLPTQDLSRSLEYAPRGALDVAIYGVSLLLDGRLKNDIAQYAGQAELIVLPAPNPRQVQPTNFDHSSQLIGEAHAATRALLDQRDALPAAVSPARRAA